MSAYNYGRREFMKLALQLLLLSLFPNFSFAGVEEDRTAWYREAKFGMFIHWGPYSLASVEASWPIMSPKQEFPIIRSRISRAAGALQPDEVRSLRLRRSGEAAGQRYMVFTTKHHDGFCMFDSSYTDYKITNTPYGKDIVAQLAEACKRGEMPLGFYYSPPDMNHPAFRDTTKLAKDNWEWRTPAPRVAPLFGLHATAAHRTVDPLRPRRADLVRRFTSPGKIRRHSFSEPHPSIAAGHAGKR